MTAASASTPPTSQRSVDSIISAPPLDWSSEDFFAEPARLECLNILYHLGPYTNDPLLVLGERGSGRSTLLAQLSAKSEDNWRLVTVAGTPGLRTRDFYGQVAQAFGLTHVADDGSAAWIAGMLAHFRHLLRAGQHPVLLVDDVDLLPQEVLTLLRELAREIKRNGDFVGLVFTALPGFAQSPVLHDLRELGGHVFVLQPLDELTARKFIAHQLRRRGLPPGTLDERALAAVLRRARGSVAELAAQVERGAPAQTQLDTASVAPAAASPNEHDIPAAVQPPAPPKPGITMIPDKRRRPLGKWLAGGALGSALLAALIFQDRINELIAPPSRDVSAGQTRLELPVMSAADNASTAQEASSLSADGSAAGARPAEAMSVSVPSPVNEQAMTAGASEPPLVVAPEVTLAALAEPPQAAASQDPLVTAPHPFAENAVSSESLQSGPPLVESMLLADVEETAPVASESAAQPAGLLPVAPAAMPEAAQTTPPPPAAMETTAPALTTVESPVAAASATSPAAIAPPGVPAESNLLGKPNSAPSGSIQDDAWYLNQSAEDFTVQIMALRSEEELRKIARRVKEGGPLAIYGFKRESGPMFALTYGRYPSREAALRASKQLPKELGKVQPWVRKFKIIQQEIRQAQSP